MSYTAPPINAPVYLEPGYTPPVLSTPVVLGVDETFISGTLFATLGAPELSCTLTARECPIQSADSAWLNALYRPAPPTLTATADYLHNATLAVTLPPPELPVRLIARERFITGALSVTLPPPALPATLTATADYLHRLVFAASLPAPVLGAALSASGTQDLLLSDDMGPRRALRQQAARATAVGTRITQQAMQPANTAATLRQAESAPIRVGARLLQAAGIPLQTRLTAPHTHGLPVMTSAALAQAEMIRLRHSRRLIEAHSLPVTRGARLSDAETIRTQTRRDLLHQLALPVTLRLTAGQHAAIQTASRLSLRWTHADWPAPGRWWPFYEVPSLSIPVILEAPYTPRPLRCQVVLSWRWITQPYCVGFDPDPESPTVRIPVREVYIVINTFSLVRADTGQPVDALDFSASLDADSWGWSWSATVPASQMSRVRSPELGEFVELLATLNGTALRCVVERLSRSRQFGSSALKISGRGRAAWLAEPNSPIITVMNAETRTAQQLLNDALTVNGVSLGWTVDWQLEDWSVPAGAWSYTGTYIGAAQRLAESGGGYVQADAALQTLHILPYYPTAPWQWATETPDVGLPDAVCTTEDLEWQDRPAYNAVWVVGQDQGRRDLIKRAGTAGDVLAPTVVDPLATDTIMTRQRGLRVIADTGRQVHVSVKLPILAETGIIMPGTLLEYTEQGQTHLGLSRAVSVQWGFPDAWQTIKVETHELESV